MAVPMRNRTRSGRVPAGRRGRRRCRGRAARGAFGEHGDAHRRRALRQAVFANGEQGVAFIEDVVDQQHVAAGHAVIRPPAPFQATALGAAIPGGMGIVELEVGHQGQAQFGGEEQAAIHDGDEQRPLDTGEGAVDIQRRGPDGGGDGGLVVQAVGGGENGAVLAGRLHGRVPGGAAAGRGGQAWAAPPRRVVRNGRTDGRRRGRPAAARRRPQAGGRPAAPRGRRPAGLAAPEVQTGTHGRCGAAGRARTQARADRVEGLPVAACLQLRPVRCRRPCQAQQALAVSSSWSQGTAARASSTCAGWQAARHRSRPQCSCTRRATAPAPSAATMACRR